MAGEAAGKSGSEDFHPDQVQRQRRPRHQLGSSGKVEINLGGNGYAESMVVDSVGRIVLGGFTGDELQRRTRDATRPTARWTRPSAPGARSSRTFPSRPPHKGRDRPSGRRQDRACRRDQVARFNANGTIDTGFGTNGVVVTHAGTNDHFGGVTIQADGRIVVSESPSYTPHAIYLVRYTTTGALDSGFGAAGIATVDWPGAVLVWGRCRAAALRSREAARSSSPRSLH